MDAPVKKPIDLSVYSVYTGIAAQDIAEETITLEVICPELLPNAAYGAVGSGITEGSLTLKDRDGNPITSRVTTANHLVATWAGASNMRYPPRVRKGEPVEVYRIANQDKFYWRTTGRGRDFRTTDRLHFEVAAGDPSKPGAEKNDTNTYSAYLDSEGKKFGVKTSMANGEKVAMSIEGDLAAGTFHMSDNGTDPGNRLFMSMGTDGSPPVFQVNLASGITFKLEGDDAYFSVPGNLFMDIKKRFVVNTPLMVFNTETKGEIIFNALNVAINASKDFIVSAKGVIGLNAMSTKVSGILIAASLRAASANKAPAGSKYTPSTISRPATDQVKPASNVADTSDTGLPYRT